MSVNVSIPSAFRRHTEGLDHYELQALTCLLAGLARQPLP